MTTPTFKFRDARFGLAWLMPAAVAWAAWHSVWSALACAALLQVGFAVVERMAPRWTSPPAASQAHPWFAWCLRAHLAWQWALQGWGMLVAVRHVVGAGSAFEALAGVVAVGLAVGLIAGSQGITYAHELGHSKSPVDRTVAWALMSSVGYAHFMVEHYRGHHVRAATHADHASARRGETLWQFFPRTLGGSLRSAWQLELAQCKRMNRSLWRSPLLWASVMQVLVPLLLGAAFGWAALLFWLVQAAYAVYLLETINYVEHYGLQRRIVNGRAEPFGMQHAWNADHAATNVLLANLQRHSDHHMHVWKSYPTLEALPGPQLPTGYAGCMFMAAVPSLWFKVMHPRLDAMSGHVPG
jgi:alkane 1-monooxygenase